MNKDISWLHLLVLGTVCASQAFGGGYVRGEDEALSVGKTKTHRTIFLEATVAASPAEVFRLWTTADGVKQFFALAAKIDPTPGGRYEIIFAPDRDPEGLSLGTKGARVLKAVPARELAFEWITFSAEQSAGDAAPPYAAPEERNATPLPTWVEMTFSPVRDDPDRTLIKFAHYGFGEGENWEKSYAWFSRVWPRVLQNLATHCAAQPRS